MIVDYLDLDKASRVSFLNDGFRGRFDDACVVGYSSVQLQTEAERRDPLVLIFGPLTQNVIAH